jgi:tetratricopeptide (TPR) repeat protein
MAATRNPRAHTVARRWRIPPPLRGDIGFNGPEGIPVLEEIGGALGSLVWGTLRTVTAWIDTPLEERAEMFPEDAARRRMAEVLEASPPAVIEGALTDLVSILDKPAEADPAAVGIACIRVARWAEEKRHLRTAAQFYQAAANACLTNAEYALAAARGARDLADYPRAEVWLQRTIGLSRQNGDWETYTKAFLAFGVMARRRGNLPGARRHAERALRRALRGGHAVLKARAYHDLFAVEAERGNVGDAEDYARSALRSYPPSDPGLHRLASDLGYLWLAQARPAAALETFQNIRLVASFRSIPFVLGGIALAAGHCGREEVHREAEAALAGIGGNVPGVAEAWAEVAEGAIQLGNWDCAFAALDRAGGLAGERREHRVEFTVDSLRARIAAERDTQPREALADERQPEVLEPLALEVISALQAA